MLRALRLPMVNPRRPSFARDFPRTPELDALAHAFAVGNYAYVRRHAPELERSTDDPLVRGAARTLTNRTKPDPLVVMLLVTAAVLLAILAAWSIIWGKPAR